MPADANKSFMLHSKFKPAGDQPGAIAQLLEGLDAYEQGLGGVEPWTLLVGAVVAAIVGWCALRLLLVLLERAAFLWFAFYCAGLGLSWLLLR